MFSRLTSYIFKMSFVLALAVSSGTSSGFDLGPVKVHGFISQGFSLSSGNNFLGESTSGSFDSSMAAVNFLWAPDPGVYFSGQLISRNYGDFSINEEDLAVDYALMNVDLFTDISNEFDLRFGLLKIPMGMYGQTRDIPVTFPGVVLPQVIYAERTRNSFLRSEGAAIEYKHNSMIGSLNIEAQAGQIRMPRNEMYDISSSRIFNVPDPGFLATKVMYHSPQDMFFAGISRLLIDYKTYSSSTVEPFRIDSTNDNLITTDIFSAGINIGSWVLTSEYMRRKNDFTNTSYMYSAGTGNLITSFEYKDINVADAYFVQVEKMIGPQLSAFIRNDHGYVVTANGKTTNNYTNSYVIGTNWRPTSNILLKAEYHNIEGASADMILIDDNPNKINGYDRYWDLFMLQFIYSF